MKKPITISRTSKTSGLRTVSRSMAGAAATIIVTEIGRRLIDRRRNRISRRNSQPAARIKRAAAGSGIISAASVQWDTPMEQRALLNLDRGQIITMLAVADNLRSTSPAAAVALTDIVASQGGPDACHGRNQLTALLQTVYPHPAVVQSAQAALREAEEMGDNVLTSKLGAREVEYLLYVHGESRMSEGRLERFCGDLNDIARELSQRGDNNREISARIILADLYLRRGDVSQANEQLTLALNLKSSMGDTSGIEGLTELGSGIEGRQVLTPSDTAS